MTSELPCWDQEVTFWGSFVISAGNLKRLTSKYKCCFLGDLKVGKEKNLTSDYCLSTP